VLHCADVADSKLTSYKEVANNILTIATNLNKEKGANNNIYLNKIRESQLKEL